MKGIVIFLIILLVFGAFGSCTSESSSNGKYGYGEQYDRDVYEAADAFGENPDHVNDVYEGLANEMR